MPNSKFDFPELHHGCCCPICENESVRRKKRSSWMWLIPGSKNYYCKICKARFMQVFGRITWLFKPKDNRKPSQLILVAIAVLLAFLCLYLFMEHDKGSAPSDGQAVVPTE
jgi:hypothetical protein